MFGDKKAVEIKEVSHPKRILLVSYFRSGTSWVGELLYRIPNSFYVFEPLHPMKDDREGDEEHEFYSSYREKRIHELFLCGISPVFMQHVRNWYILYKNLRCNNPKCKTFKNITEHCTSSDYIILKTVRLYLYDVENLLIKPSLQDVKIIFLTRDARGVVNSLNNMEDLMKRRVKLACPKLREDVQAYKSLKKNFPNQIIFVRYEDFALNPIEKALDIWRFVSGDMSQTELPSEWKKYLDKSNVKTEGSHVGSYNLSANSLQNWQAWREMIPKDLFLKTELECDDVLTSLGYKLLNNISSVRNLSIPSLFPHSCTSIPCVQE